jgi:hypothetical protein
LTGLGALLPPLAGADGILPAAALGRVLIDIWTEAGRDDVLRSRLRAAYEAHLDSSLHTGAADDRGLATILRIGALIQALTRGDGGDPSEVARRLGIEQAA